MKNTEDSGETEHISEKWKISYYNKLFQISFVYESFQIAQGEWKCLAMSTPQ